MRKPVQCAASRHMIIVIVLFTNVDMRSGSNLSTPVLRPGYEGPLPLTIRWRPRQAAGWRGGNFGLPVGITRM